MSQIDLRRFKCVRNKSTQVDFGNVARNFSRRARITYCSFPSAVENLLLRYPKSVRADFNNPIQSIPFKQLNLPIERYLMTSVMTRLVLDVVSNTGHIFCGNSESAISSLPFEEVIGRDFKRHQV